RRIFFIITLSCMAFSCTSIQKSLVNTVSSQLSGSDKNGKPLKVKESGNSMMIPLTGESDPILMADFFPTALKLYEILHVQNPSHQGITSMTASLYVMYANAFIQHKADMLPSDQYEKQNSEYKRAKMHYLRGRNYAMEVFEQRYPGFTADILSTNEDQIAQAVSKLQLQDVENAYWLGSSWLGAWSVEPLDPFILPTIGGAVGILERAASLNPDFNDGAIWDVLTSFYAGAPADFGGSMERAIEVHQKALDASKGMTAGPYVTYAQSICISLQDYDGFDTALEKALLINPDDNPSTRLATIISQEKARFLQNNRDNFFIFW
ncbi:MAG TPA: TRAP transporter TatT component family protein, partial [Treponemataceae bacterium]|nr:TRAP transporter TatT component family protein [Treponemataceae bacterium]